MTFEIRFLGFFVVIQTGLILQTASRGSITKFLTKNCKEVLHKVNALIGMPLHLEVAVS
jgi:hypothetical protein